ncbi:hypothetical protein BB561_000940 [Smittium simulii]|uniref:Peptidase S1 domain-containing protein n=1 Tax=Smittium simulii TaxID=133385 RepID=A0A2T9YWX1_9FUNG|nr:hypothetical protein BB561_000940 [Smittium simulii]
MKKHIKFLILFYVSALVAGLDIKNSIRKNRSILENSTESDPPDNGYYVEDNSEDTEEAGESEENKDSKLDENSNTNDPNKAEDSEKEKNNDSADAKEDPGEDEDDTEIITNIINGKIATKKEYPYIVQIFKAKDGKKFNFMCTGSLIGPKHILTAAHCGCDDNRNNLSPSNIRVAVGTVSRLKGNDVKLRKISKIIPLGYKQTPTNDIAVFELSSSVPSNEATPVKLYNYKILNSYTFDVAGFGLVDPVKGILPENLLKVEIKASSSRNCTEFGSGWKSNAGNQFCSENYNGNDSCQGDSGGPVTRKVLGRSYLAGVVSYGVNKNPKSNVDCGPNVISYYTRTSYFINEIAKAMQVSPRSLY